MSERSRKKDEKNDNKSKEPLLKILMLHGYRQSETAFREKSGGLRKYLKNHAEFIFCEAPHTIPKKADSSDLDNNASSSEIEKGWWFSTTDKSYNALDVTECDSGFSEAIGFINEIFQTKGPFDGIFGFSQGGCLASILCKIAMNQENIYEFIRFKFAIIAAGFKSNQTQHNCFYDLNIKISLPTLHLIGNGDKVIPSDLSNNLTNYFLDPKILYHDGGHFIPVNAESKVAFVEFLSSLKQTIFNK